MINLLALSINSASLDIQVHITLILSEMEVKILVIHSMILPVINLVKQCKSRIGIHFMIPCEILIQSGTRLGIPSVSPLAIPIVTFLCSTHCPMQVLTIIHRILQSTLVPSHNSKGEVEEEIVVRCGVVVVRNFQRLILRDRVIYPALVYPRNLLGHLDNPDNLHLLQHCP